MAAFTQNTTKSLCFGAAVLAAGVYYYNAAAIQLNEAENALRKVKIAQANAETADQNFQHYALLHASLDDRDVEHQEPFAVDSELSPHEISRMGPLLDALYRRDGHFFLEQFQLSWQYGDTSQGFLPRVALELEGRKVLAFDDDLHDASMLASMKP